MPAPARWLACWQVPNGAQHIPEFWLKQFNQQVAAQIRQQTTALIRLARLQ
jgi:hypothetical protein